MSSLIEVAEAMADAIAAIKATLPDLQVEPTMVLNASGPTVDIYPAEPAQEDTSFAPESSLALWTVRARINTADHDASQHVLLQLMEPVGPTSIRGALLASSALAAKLEGDHGIYVERPTGYQVYAAPVQATGDFSGSYLGFEHRVRTHIETEVS